MTLQEWSTSLDLEQMLAVAEAWIGSYQLEPIAIRWLHAARHLLTDEFRQYLSGFENNRASNRRMQIIPWPLSEYPPSPIRRNDTAKVNAMNAVASLFHREVRLSILQAGRALALEQIYGTSSAPIVSDPESVKDAYQTVAWDMIRAQTASLRCLIRQPDSRVTFEPAWRTSTVLALASQMDELKDYLGMPILADALQDAGCEETELLGHCRGDSHVSGCWVIEMLLRTG
jgi:hypothetical protein